MLKLGVIGTNWITHAFVNAALQSQEYQLSAVYSRTKGKAEKFASKYDDAENIHIITELSELCELDEVDVVYIASPNSLHYEQARLLMSHNKHVIVEKPAVSTLEELEELIELAEEKEVFFFEAARHIHEENFQRVASFLKNRDDILGANLTFMKYSSRYDALLRGEEPNIFSSKYSGGALMDLGVYLVYTAVAWFGRPASVFYFNQKLPTDVDGLGTMIFRYETFDVTMTVGKNADSFLPSEIYLSDSTLCLDAVNSIGSIIQKKRENSQLTEIDFGAEKTEIVMLEEARAFANIMVNPMGIKQQKVYQDWVQLARDVHGLMETMRKESDIIFAADAKEIRG
ncbi:Gfo/Idh/MocA family protein [Vagococcus sp. JNUCC 83]